MTTELSELTEDRPEGDLGAETPLGRVSRRRRWMALAFGVVLIAAAVLWLVRRDAVGDELAISKAEAKYLQDVEHLGGFVLGFRTFPLIGAAIRDRDADALKEFLTGDFRGQLFDPDAARIIRRPMAEFRTWREQPNATNELDRDQFVEKLLTLRDRFAKLEAHGVKVKLMSPVERGKLDGPWQGTFKLRLAGRDRDGGLLESVIMFRCRITAITESMPERRGWLAACEAYEAREARSEQPLLEEMTDETGIRVGALWDNWTKTWVEQLPFQTGGIYLADYNQDGAIDALVTDMNGLAMYRGTGRGWFVDVTDEVGLPREISQLGAAFADFDNDGFEDLIIHSTLFRNVEGRRFEQVDESQTKLGLGPGARFALADYDGDGLVDLYVVGLAQDTPDGEYSQWIGKNSMSRNELWRNRGDFRFEDVTESSGTAGCGSATFAAVWFDADGDGHPDIMTSCEFGQNDYFLNNGDGTFRRGTLPDGFGGFSMGITVGDIDNDGFGDPYVANMYSSAGVRIVANLDPSIYPRQTDALLRDFVTGSELYSNSGDGTFSRTGQAAGVATVGWAYGCSYIDLNGDGLLDIYAPVGHQSITRDKPDG